MMSWRHIVVRPNSAALGVLAVACVLTLVYRDMANPSPGDLAAVHAQVAELAGDHCAACHGSGDTAMADACAACHAEIAAQIRDRSGLHGQLPSGEAPDCARCHSEHHGADFGITSQRSFRLAGVPNRDQYDHAGLNFTLQGKHLSAACEACHPSALAQVLTKGEKRFLGLCQECTACHEDVHQGDYGPDCQSCHGQQHPFRMVAEFEHTSAFALEDAHAAVECQACHPPDSPYAIDTLLRHDHSVGEPAMVARPCQSCHRAPHSRPFLAVASREFHVSAERSCAGCHPVSHSAFYGPQATMTEEFHAQIGFPLTAPHDQVTCDQCHVGHAQPKDGEHAFRAAFPGRQADQCQACHSDPHGGQFDTDAPNVGSCLDCHHADCFVPAAFGVTEHQRTRFPLQGAHARLECQTCHRQRLASSPTGALSAGANILYRGMSTACGSCHTDPHDGQFDRGDNPPGDCHRCHNQIAFRWSSFSVLDHDRTRFPLTGAHQAVACQACHPATGEDAVTDDAPSSQSPERRRYRGTPQDCGACHEDVHLGQFDRPGVPRQVGGEEGCLRCHYTDRFDRVTRPVFDHALWTGYALQGAHGAIQCQACHPVSVRPDAQGRSFGRAAGQECQACHRDPHAGQFGAPAEMDCRRCHVDGDSFRQMVFDHQTHSRFPLDQDHIHLSCDTCHKPQGLPDGSAIVRYRPLGTECGDCHVPRGPRQPRSRRRP